MGDETTRSASVPDQELEQIVGGTGVSTGITVPSGTVRRVPQLGEAESVRNMTYKGGTIGLPLDPPDPPSSF